MTDLKLTYTQDENALPILLEGSPVDDPAYSEALANKVAARLTAGKAEALAQVATRTQASIDEAMPEIKQDVAAHVQASVKQGLPGASVEKVEQVNQYAARFVRDDGQVIGQVSLPAGPKGDQGLPGVNAVPADEAVAAYIQAESSRTSGALVDGFITTVRGASVHNFKQFEGANHSQQLMNAVTALGAAAGESVLQVTEDIILTEPIELDIKNVSIDFNGKSIISRVKGQPTITVTNTTGAVLPMNRRFFKNLYMRGPGSTDPGSVAIRFATDDPKGVDNSRGALFENIEIESFETALSFGKNAYLIRFVNGHIYRCHTCIRVEDKAHDPALPNTNYGENIAFFGFSLGNSKLGVYLGDNDLTDVNMYGCSFDFLQGGGQRMAVVKSGQLNLTDAHIEINGALTAGPIIVTGPNSAGEVRIKGSRIQHNNEPPADADYWFESLNPHDSGGITIADTTLHFVHAKSGVLCKGPGRFNTHNLSFPSGTNGSGYAAGTVLTTRAQNLLGDPGFTQSQNIDVQVLDANATSLTESPSHAITNEGGKLVLTKKTTGAGSFMISVPVVHGKFYAVGFQLGSYSTADGGAPGRLRLQERFAVVRARDALGREIPVRTASRPEVGWDVPALSGVFKAQGPLYAGGATVASRMAPYWATHYQVVFPVSNLAPGRYVFDEILMTGA